MGTCALVGASDFNADKFKGMYDEGMFDLIIAVDAGYEHLKSLDIKPDLVMGDFDSLGYEPLDVRHVRFSVKKDKSDMELAIARAKTMKSDSIYAFGVLGGRLDHTVANLGIFAKASEMGMAVCIVDMDIAIFYITGPDVFEAEAIESGTVSVFSATDESSGVFERGMEWDLDDVVLDNKTSRGLSNELIGEPVMIGVENGTLMIFFPI